MNFESTVTVKDIISYYSPTCDHFRVFVSISLSAVSSPWYQQVVNLVMVTSDQQLG